MQRDDSLTRRERVVLWALLGVVVLFGLITEYRSAFLRRRMADLGVFLRAAWAVRQGGAELYTVTCNNGWHYHYPPLLAILMGPLADPPAGADPVSALPYGASVAVWYVVSLFFLGLGLHVLASALESTLPEPPPRFGRRWWTLRLLPLLACLVHVGAALGRGQVTPLWLALECGFLAALVRGRSLAAGLWLAGAVCLKIIPGFLLLIPLVRRDGRCLAGCVLGLVVGLILVPAAVFGPAQTVRLYEELGRVLLAPALGAGDDGSRAVELLQVTATDNQSIQAMIHNTLHPVRATRPDEAAPAVRLLHWLLGGILTLITLWAYLLPPSPPALQGRGVGGEGVKWIALRLRTHTQSTPPHPRPLSPAKPGERGERGGTELVVFAGCLTLCMILVSPVSHLHYFTLMAPLVMGLLLGEEDQPFPGAALAAALVVFFLLSLLPRLPWWRLPREVGVASYGALLLWGLGVRRMGRVRFLDRAGLPEGRLRPRLQ